MKTKKTLTPREQEVAMLTALGCTSHDLTLKLGISLQRVCAIRRTITEKIGLLPCSFWMLFDTEKLKGESDNE
jgi:DNA-binding CsgD family transcriptional regulator